MTLGGARTVPGGVLALVFGADSRITKEPLALACVLFLMLIWAAWFVVSRWGVLGAMTPADIVLVRYLTGAMLVLPFVWLCRGRTIPWKVLAVLIVTYGFPYVLFVFLGLQQAPAANAGVLINGLLPVCNVLLALLVFRQGIGLGKWFAVLLLAGANGCMLAAGLQDASLSWAWLWLIAATVLLACYLTTYRRHPLDWQVLLPAMSLGNLALFLPLWLVLPSNLAAAPWTEIAIQAFFQGFINQVVVLLLIAYSLPRLGTVTTAVLYGFVPATTALLAWATLGEALLPLEVIGVLGCTAGIIVFSRSR